MEPSTRDDLETLGQRVAQLEHRARQSEAQVKSLQARLDAMAGSVAGAADGFRDRSRSPARLSNYQMLQKPLAAPVLQTLPKQQLLGTSVTVEEFAQENHLDDKCLEVLSNQTPEVQHYVISQGPAEGRNPSAMVMGRIAKCMSELGPVGGYGSGYSGGGCGTFGFSGVGGHSPGVAPQCGGGGGCGAPFAAKVDAFCIENGIDEKCAEALRSQSVECQMLVVAQGPADGRNPSAMVTGRINKFQRGEL